MLLFSDLSRVVHVVPVRARATRGFSPWDIVRFSWAEGSLKKGPSTNLFSYASGKVSPRSYPIQDRCLAWQVAALVDLPALWLFASLKQVWSGSKERVLSEQGKAFS